MKLTRREFGKKVLYSAAALSASLSFPMFLIPSAAKSRVVFARSEKLKRRECSLFFRPGHSKNYG
jgi:hypothetical protein